ncbi:serine hydrolase domain-containing protein [Cohnella sp. GCM10027633]|uniref:serine hydrolase domain-containing protein n=1 Tax=unclassified Cohnella TaxID=2636738 RepID=UPI0036286649
MKRTVWLLALSIAVSASPLSADAKELLDDEYEYFGAKFVRFDSTYAAPGGEAYIELREGCDVISGELTVFSASKRQSCEKNNIVYLSNDGLMIRNDYYVPMDEFFDRMNVRYTPMRVSGETLLTDLTYGMSTGELIESYLTRLNHMEKFNGSNLVAIDGNVLTKKGYGYASMDAKIPNEPSTKFAIASITKTFTALAVLQLQEQGKLRTKDKAAKYLPSLPHGDEIAINQMLTHTAGLPKSAKDLKRLTLAYEPGKGQMYSNLDYILLGQIISKASGMSYEAYIEKYVLEPAGLRHTGYDLSRSGSPTKGYAYKTGKGYVEQFMDYPSRGGSGSLYSTVEDLYLWDRVLYTDKLLRKQAAVNLFHLKTGHGSWGYGWMNFDGPYGQINMMSGTNKGFRSHIRRNLTQDYAIILLSNHSNEGLDLAAKDIEDLMMRYK